MCLRRPEEVASELGYRDLTQELGPSPLLRKHFGHALPKVVGRAARDWAEYGLQFIDLFEKLRQPGLSRVERASLADELENAANRILREQEEEEEEGEPDWDPLDWSDYEQE